MFLDDEELAELTGYRQARKQVAMLKRQGVPFYLNAAGHPRVVRAILEGKHAAKASTANTDWTPSWAGKQL